MLTSQNQKPANMCTLILLWFNRIVFYALCLVCVAYLVYWRDCSYEIEIENKSRSRVFGLLSL